MSNELHLSVKQEMDFVTPAVRLVTNQSTLTQISFAINMSGANTATIYWGDGNTTAVSGIGSTYSHNYASTGTYNFRMYGKKDTIIKFHNSAGNSTISGDIATFKACTGLTFLYVNSSSVSGDITNLSGLTSLVYLYIDATSVSGDIADLSGLTGLSGIYLYVSSVDTYTSTTLPDWEGTDIRIYSLGLSETEVDNFLCDLDGATGSPGNGTLLIHGTNAAPSATGLTCKTNLVAKGRTVTTSS